MNKFKRSVSFETDSESQPLLSSDSSNASFGTHHQIMFPGSETSDFDQSQSYLDAQVHQQTRLQNSPFSKLNLKSVTQNVKRSESKPPPTSEDYRKKSIYTIPSLTSDKNYLPSSKVFSITTDDSIEKPKTASTQSSIVTIFSIWNTTMGSSLLTMAWAIQKAGFIPGIFIIILLGALCAYTAYCCIQVSRDHGGALNAVEIPVLCNMLLGKWAQRLSELFSIIVLMGASIVYLILMTNFLYNTVQFLIDAIQDTPNETNYTIASGNVICPGNDKFELVNVTLSTSSQPSLIIWNKYSTVPIILSILLFPCLNVSNITFFTKFNCLGTLSVMYLIVFVITKGSTWGIHWSSEPIISGSFPALTGTLSLSYFIHNIIISILKNNRNQRKNGRDLSIAFGLITTTYLIIGGVFYITFPLGKSCIKDNIFDNFLQSDSMTLVARVLLLFQISVTFPLIVYMLRINIFGLFVKKSKIESEGGEMMETSSSHHTEIKFPKKWIFLFNFVIVVICILFACFYPKIGTLIRYTGALSGLVYIFTLPALLKIVSLKKRGKLTKLKLLLFVCIPIIGACNLFAQFFISAN